VRLGMMFVLFPNLEDVCWPCVLVLIAVGG